MDKNVLCQTIREVLPIMKLLKEVNSLFGLNLISLKIRCMVYEKNERCVPLTKIQRFSPRVDYLVIKYHQILESCE